MEISLRVTGTENASLHVDVNHFGTNLPVVSSLLTTLSNLPISEKENTRNVINYFLLSVLSLSIFLRQFTEVSCMIFFEFDEVFRPVLLKDSDIKCKFI